MSPKRRVRAAHGPHARPKPTNFLNNRLPRFVLSWFLSTEWFGTAFREFLSIFCCTESNSELCSLPRNGSERNSIYLGSTERNSKLCSLPQKGSEQNYGSLLLFLFHGTEFRVIFSSAEGFGTEFRDFLFRGTTGIPSEITICSVYSVFRGIIFLSEIPNPSRDTSINPGQGEFGKLHPGWGRENRYTFLQCTPLVTQHRQKSVLSQYSAGQSTHTENCCQDVTYHRLAYVQVYIMQKLY